MPQLAVPSQSRPSCFAALQDCATATWRLYAGGTFKRQIQGRLFTCHLYKRPNALSSCPWGSRQRNGCQRRTEPCRMARCLLVLQSTVVLTEPEAHGKTCQHQQDNLVPHTSRHTVATMTLTAGATSIRQARCWVIPTSIRRRYMQRW